MNAAVICRGFVELIESARISAASATVRSASLSAA